MNAEFFTIGPVNSRKKQKRLKPPKALEELVKVTGECRTAGLDDPAPGTWLIL